MLKGVHMYSTVQDRLGTDVEKPGGPHMKGPGAMFTGGSLMEGNFSGAGGPAGYADRISIDQELAQSIGADAPFRSLELGVGIRGQEPLRIISYRGAGMPNPCMEDPVAVYDRLFGQLGLSQGELEQRRADEKSVIDFLCSDLKALGSRMSASDRSRLDSHCSGLREIEQSLDAAASACSVPDPPAQSEQFDVAARALLEVLAFAHRCELTRVSTFMFANSNSWQYYPFIGIDEEHHALSHEDHTDASVLERLAAIQEWHARQLATFLDLLAEQDASTGESVLDRSLVVWGNELGQGNPHLYTDIPWCLVSGRHVPIATGRAYDMGDRPHNDLLRTIGHAMGRTDLSTFGIPALNTGLMSEILV